MVILTTSGYLTEPWKITRLLIGKPSISMGHLYHGYVSHNQRVTTSNEPIKRTASTVANDGCLEATHLRPRLLIRLLSSAAFMGCEATAGCV